MDGGIATEDGGLATEDGGLPTEDGGLGTNVIGPEGGTVVGEGGQVRLELPAGALTQPTLITVARQSVPPEAGFVGDVVYDLGPDGLAFAAPVRLTLAYDPAAVRGPETSLRIGKLIEGGVGELAQDPAVDTSLRTAAGSLSSFSSYGVTGAPRPFYFTAEYQSDRSIRVSWTSGGGSLTVDRARCIYDSSQMCCANVPSQRCANPLALDDPNDTDFAYYTGGSTGDLFDRSLPAVSATYWYRIKDSVGRERAREKVFIFGLPAAPGPATGFTATPEPDGGILLTWDPSGESDVSFVLTREVCGAEELLTELPASATSFTDSRAFGLAPGAAYTYRLFRRNSAGDSNPVSASATSAVAPGECQDFTLSVPSCDIAVPSGGSATVEVEIQRTGGAPLSVALRLEPLGSFGFFVQHSFSPEAPSEGNSLLTLTDLGGSTRQSGIIRGQASPSGTMCFTPISVHFTGTAVPVTLTTYAGRSPANALWAVSRVGDAAWEPLQGNAGRYDFRASTAGGGRYSIAVACDATTVKVLDLTTSETTAPSVRCDASGVAHLVQGTFQNLPADHCVAGSLGDRSFASCYTQGYAAYVPAATHDLIATIHPFTGGGQHAVAPDAIRLVRDLVITGPTTYPLDLAGAVSAAPGLVQITPSADLSFVVFRTANRARTVLGYAGSTTQFSYGGVPFANQRTGDIHELSASRLEETRRIFFRTPADHLVDFSIPLAWSSAAVNEAASTSHRRFTLSADRVAGTSAYEVALVSYDLMNEIDPVRTWTTFVSTGWLDASALGSPFAYSTPDLGAAPGFDPGWGLHDQPDAVVNYDLTAHVGSGTLTTLLQTLAGVYGSVSHGYVWRTAVRNGSVP
jgi:hypothetical protein